MEYKIFIAKDFSETPGPRYKKDGEYSGEQFRDDILLPKFKECSDNDKIIIDLDGGYGYPSSFLEEAFGGLARIFPPEQVSAKLVFISTEEPSLIETIQNYIIRARAK